MVSDISRISEFISLYENGDLIIEEKFALMIIMMRYGKGTRKMIFGKESNIILSPKFIFIEIQFCIGQWSTMI